MKKTPAVHVRAWRQLMHVHARVTSAIDSELRGRIDLPGSWYEALVEIAFAGGAMKMSEFASETTLTKSGATRFVDRLVSAGLVERIQCPTDRRIWQLALSEEGKRVQKEADPIVLDVLDREFGRHLTDESNSRLLELLTRVRVQAGSSKSEANSMISA